ncbi:MAG: hypothetical protein JW966_04620 [Anaerolineae bacterium]|nr:hypothetical protein [Anaerolineae bacterium]
MKKTIIVLVVIAALAVGVMPAAAVEVATPDTSNTGQALACVNGIDAVAVLNAKVRLYASTESFSTTLVVVPAGAIVKTIAMDHTGGWLLVCYAGVVGWTSRDLYRPATDVPLQFAPILGGDVTTPPDVIIVIDSDLDGYPDNKDFCPNTKAGYLPGSVAERPEPYTGCPHDKIKVIDSDLDGYPNNVDFCPYDAAGYLPGSAAERPEPYTGCPHDSALKQCQDTSPTGVCINILGPTYTVDMTTYGGTVAPGTCMFYDVVTDGCWVHVVAKRAGNTEFVVRSYSTANVGAVVVGMLFEGWAKTYMFGPVVGDLALVPSY